jgi:hypothetical protein
MMESSDFWQTEAGAKTLGGSPKSLEPRQFNTFRFSTSNRKNGKTEFLDEFCYTRGRLAKVVPRILWQQAFGAAPSQTLNPGLRD